MRTQGSNNEQHAASALTGDRQQPIERLSVRFVVGTSLILTWIVLFAGGMVIGTKKFVSELNPSSRPNSSVSIDQRLAFAMLKRDVPSSVPLTEASFAALSRADATVVLEFAKKQQQAPIGSANLDQMLAATEMTTPDSDAERHEVGKPIATADQNPSLTEPKLDSTLEWKSSLSFLEKCHHWFFVVTCYTLTNVALLSCVSSILGGLYRSSRDRVRPDSSSDLATIGPEWYLAGVIQGFIIYLALISGLLVVGDQTFTETTPDQYIKLAGLASIVSFWAGFNPGAFVSSLIKLLPLPSGPVASPPSV